MEHDVKLAERLREFMDLRDINQRQLELATKLSNQAISFWLSKQRLPSLLSLWDFCASFQKFSRAVLIKRLQIFFEYGIINKMRRRGGIGRRAGLKIRW